MLVHQEILASLNNRFEVPTIVFTNQLFGTYDRGSGRYHIRVIMFGHPCLISTTGLVEGPARPREYYLKRWMGIDHMDLSREFERRIIQCEDARLTEIMKGYLMQAVFYYASGDPFCKDRACRLFNAHWQEDVIRAQLRGGKEFCERHHEMLEMAGRSHHGVRGG